MNSEIIEYFLLTQATCSQRDHQGLQVASLCIRPQCREMSSCCQKCQLYIHGECRDHIVFNDEVQEKINEISNIEILFEQLISNVSQSFQKIKKVLEDSMQPIRKYKTCQNLQNLNLLGDLIRANSINQIPQLIGQTQQVVSDQLTKLLKSMELIRFIHEPTQQQIDEAEKQCKESQEWELKQNYDKSLDCIERAVELVNNNEEYQYLKGLYLYELKRYDDAIESLTKSISIKPTSDAYSWKAGSLFRLNRLKEAIDCVEEGLTQWPNHIQLISQKNYFQSKLGSES